MSPGAFRKARTDLGLTQGALAAQIGFTDRAVRYWEAGMRPIPRSAELAIGRMVEAAARKAKRRKAQ